MRDQLYVDRRRSGLAETAVPRLLAKLLKAGELVNQENGRTEYRLV
jgi:hypothetical protein